MTKSEVSQKTRGLIATETQATLNTVRVRRQLEKNLVINISNDSENRRKNVENAKMKYLWLHGWDEE